jgi:hypothetical protein
MTTVTTNLAEHETLKSPKRLAQQSLAASTCGSAVLMIAGIDPDGSLNRAAFEHIEQAFAARQPWDGELGGEPVEQIAVYFSDASKLSFAENGLPIEASQDRSPLDYPHFAAVRGACGKLQRTHLPFGVITRKQLPVLNRYPVIVLPNVLRMDAAEADAFRAYVHAGGRLYASRYTSLTKSDGIRCNDFMLADLFGCHFEGIESGRMVYSNPQNATCRTAIEPQRYLSNAIHPGDTTGLMRLQPLKDDSQAEVLATLNVPYGHPALGSVDGRDWSSIHSSPPWADTAAPTLVRHHTGKGCVIYSAADIEAGDGDAHERLFIALLRDLLPGPPAFEADAHPSVWMTVFDQPERARWVVSLLNYAEELPVIPSRVGIRLIPPEGYSFTGLKKLPDREPLEARVDSNGVLEAEIERLGMFAMVAATYKPSNA